MRRCVVWEGGGGGAQLLVGRHEVTITPRGVAIVAIALVACASLALPLAQQHLWFVGHGFGTVLAQGLYWAAFRIVGSPEEATPLVLIVQVALATLVFAVLSALALAATFRASAVHKRLPQQQNISSLRIAVIVGSAQSTRLIHLRPLLLRIREAIAAAKPG
jgi:hypothetical protein